MKKDITYIDEDNNIKFNFRVAIISKKNNKILLQKNDKDTFYSLIGGRVKIGESTLLAVKREILEEVGIHVKDEELKLIKVIENFFTYNNIKFHELLFLYNLNNEELNKMGDFKTLDKDNSYNEWISIEELKLLDVRPYVIKDCYNEIILDNIIIGC